MTRRFTATPATPHPADVHAARVAQYLVDDLPAHVAEAAERADDPEAVVREWLFSGGLQDPFSTDVPAPPPAGTRVGLSTPRTELSHPAEPQNGTDPSGRSASRPEGEPCPHCTNGTYTRRTGPLRWQVQQMRCAFCRGTGRINPEGDA